MFLPLISSFLLIFTALSAAAPVTHAYLTYAFFDAFPDKYDYEEKKDFMIGTLFPDIRYMGETRRQNTHFDKMTLKEVLDETSPFMAGVKFHSYVDLRRDEYVSRQKIYTKFKEYTPKNLVTFLKLMEDEILYSKANWKDVSLWIKEILPEELHWNMEEPLIRKWHNILSIFFTNPTSTVVFLALMGNVELMETNRDQLSSWNLILKNKAELPQSQAYVNDLVSYFQYLYLTDRNL